MKVSTFKLVPIRGVPVNVEALYPMWHHNDGKRDDRMGMPSAYRDLSGKVPKGMGITSDFLWAWVINPDLRRPYDDAKQIEAQKNKEQNLYFRPNSRYWRYGQHIHPVRMWTGRKWQWFWLVPAKEGSGR